MTGQTVMLLVLLLSGHVVINMPVNSDVIFMRFKKMTSLTLGPHRITSGVKMRSASECASSCLLAFPACQSFMYNTETGQCVLGSKLNESQSAPSPAEGSLYIYSNRNEECKMEDGYRLTWMATKPPACLYTSTYSLVYSDASAICESTGGYLASARNSDKISLLQSFLRDQITISEAWVGLDDEHETGYFAWKDTGEIWNETAMMPFFDLGQTGGSDDNCVYINVTSGLLHSYSCDFQPLNFVCEMDF